ncbi:hypothetical protein LTR53_000159 [Teratosphaeriaceae sp. CCFEE 6253]|nr:hypothetical protein LTR53_000159 [Teratosphaeriaceae sp. CCFEE 6253]
MGPVPRKDHPTEAIRANHELIAAYIMSWPDAATLLCGPPPIRTPTSTGSNRMAASEWNANPIQREGDEVALSQPRLDQLPEELISNIALRLDYDDITSFRLTCRTLEARSFHDFATEYFSAKAFMLLTGSLKVLGAIARDARLREFLHSIYVVTAFFHQSAFSCANGCHCSWKPTVRQAEAYRLYIRDQQQLKNSGDDKKMLTEALKQLPAVTSLYLADGPSHGEMLENANLYGLRKVVRTTSRSPSCCPSTNKTDRAYSSWCTHVWKVMCQAISKSNRTSILSFGSHTTSTSDGFSVASDFKLGPTTRAGMTKALQNVKRARLSVRGNTAVRKDGGIDPDATVGVIHNFGILLRQSQLEDVSLKYDMAAMSGFVHVALSCTWHLSRLKKLAIDGVFTTADSLVHMVSSLSSVSDLLLSCSNLTEGDWKPVLRAMQKLEKLDHLHLRWLQEAGCKVFFLQQREMEEDVEEAWLDEGSNEGLGAEDDDSDGEGLLGTESPLVFDPFSKPEPIATEPPPPEEEQEFAAPGHDGGVERGYYICLKGEAQIRKYLPIFLKEYNIGENLDDEHGLPFPPGLLPTGGAGAGGPPAAFNAMMNSIFGPMPLPLRRAMHMALLQEAEQEVKVQASALRHRTTPRWAMGQATR